MNNAPNIEQFLAGPLAEVQKIAPKTLILAAGGTRRSAILAGVDTQSDAYVQWSQQQMLDCIAMLFEHGIEHIFTFAIIESQLKEVTGVYRERLLDWVDWGLSGPESLAAYAKLGWRVRLLGAEYLPELQGAAQRLVDNTAVASKQTLWWSVIPSSTAVWQSIFTAVNAVPTPPTYEAVVQALYGELVPPAQLFLSFGKPMVSPSLIPPLLMGQVQCYWTQKPGYRLTAVDFRHILYDFAYTRATWRQDKTGRAEAVLDHRQAWEAGPTIGLGQSLGPFWYPQPVN